MIIPIDAQEQDSFDPELSQTFGEQEIPNGGTLSFYLLSLQATYELLSTAVYGLAKMAILL